MAKLRRNNHNSNNARKKRIQARLRSRKVRSSRLRYLNLAKDYIQPKIRKPDWTHDFQFYIDSPDYMVDVNLTDHSIAICLLEDYEFLDLPEYRKLSLARARVILSSDPLFRTGIEEEKHDIVQEPCGVEADF